MPEQNPTWIDAPYEVTALFVVPARKFPGEWSRRRRLKAWRRHVKAYAHKLLEPPDLGEVRREDYVGELQLYWRDGLIVPVHARIILP